MLGNDYYVALAESLKMSSKLQVLNLKNNRLDDKSIVKIINNIMLNEDLVGNLIQIDLSHNHLGKEGIQKLIDLVETKGCALHRIEVENNRLGDTNVDKLVMSISKHMCSKIKFLNLNKNEISDSKTVELADAVFTFDNLEVLLLSGNKIRNKGAAAICKAIKSNVSIRILDLSWNRIGQSLLEVPSKEEVRKQMKVADEDVKLHNLDLFNLLNAPKKKNAKVSKPLDPSDFAVALSEAFKSDDCGLIHLNISQNSIGIVDGKFLGIKITSR